MLLADSLLERNGTLFQILVAVLLALVSGFAGWYARNRNKPTKTLDYRLASDLPILSHRPDDDDLKVIYMGEEVRSPRIVQVTFANTGTQVIKKADFLEPFTVTLRDAVLLDTIIVNESASNLTDFVSGIRDPLVGRVQLHIQTLNPGDTFTVQMIVDKEGPTDFEVRGRIEGQTRESSIFVTKTEISSWIGRGVRRFLAFGLLAMALGAFGLSPAMPSQVRLPAIIMISLGIAVVLFGGFAWLWVLRGVYSPRKR